MFLHEKAYQVRDTTLESSVVTKVKGVGRYGDRVLDTADYVTPPQVTAPPGGFGVGPCVPCPRSHSGHRAPPPRGRSCPK